MDERIERLVAVTGVDRAAAAKIVGSILHLLRRDADALAFITRMRRARTDYPAATDSNSADIVAALGGGIDVGPRVTAAGPGMIQAAGRETLRYAHAAVRRDAVGDVVDAIPSRVVFL
jgi:hypothetical protein